MSDVNPNVWADGFGIWHASVPITDNRRKDALTARKLIVDALAERYAPNFDPSTVHVIREKLGGTGKVIYRES